MEAQIQAWLSKHRAHGLSRKLEKIPSIGAITASALEALMGEANNFVNGRQLAAGAEAALERRQDEFAENQQTWRYVLTYVTHSWGTSSDPICPTQDGCTAVAQ